MTDGMPGDDAGNKRGQTVLGELDARKIGCDQVAWLLDIFNRYLPPSKHPRISQEREMLKYGMLYEVMEITGLKFADDAARWNGTPNAARDHGDDD